MAGLTEAKQEKDREPTPEEEAQATERASFHGMAKVAAVACAFAARKYKFENNEDDPNHPSFICPLKRTAATLGKTTGLDLCKVCGELEDGEQGDRDLTQCFTNASGHKCCEEWYHPQCIGLDQPPDGDWICQSCTNSQLKLLKLEGKAVGVEGYSFPLDL